jgi:ribonuclease HIII
MTASIKLGEEEITRLMVRISAHCLKTVPVKSAYEVLRVDDGVTVLILYKSGKFVHNESAVAEQIISEVVGMDNSYDMLLGSDEAGKGEWYGPLVAVCASAKPDDIAALRKMGVRDSKTLPKKKILELGERLQKEIKFRSVVLPPETYNMVYEGFRSEGKSLNDLLAWAHAAAIKDLLSSLKYKKAKLVIDRFDYRKTEEQLADLSRNNLEIEQKPQAESEIPVAAASIIAKFLFEKSVTELDEKFGLDLRKMNPNEVESTLLPKVAKLHFKNVP